MRSKRGAVERVGRKREGRGEEEKVERIGWRGRGRKGRQREGSKKGRWREVGGGLGKPWGGKGEQEPPLLSSVAFNCQRSLRNV